MKKIIISILIGVSLLNTLKAQNNSSKKLGKQILADKRLDSVRQKASLLISKGFTAGTSYGEIWIRDFNTFITGSLDVGAAQEVREKLLMFFKFQGTDGNIVDGIIPKNKASVGYQYRYSSLEPEWAAHKNTVETDQETSLIQAVKKYIDKTNDYQLLKQKIGDYTVLQRMYKSLEFLHNYKMVKQYGLIKGATTIDWGDVQAETGWGVIINDKTRWSIDIYDNAMLLISMNDLLDLSDIKDPGRKEFAKDAVTLKHNIRKYLWDTKLNKYTPHIYLDGSPFPREFDEQKILYTGGTTCAVLAGLHSKKEIDIINRQFVKAASSEPNATIGITVYPPYPTAFFPNVAAYTYQNGGDWTWFGGRMIRALIENGFYQEAYTEMIPMLTRVLQYNGFFEWWDVKTGVPKGSGEFRGSAGVLYDDINLLIKWAEKINQ